MEETLAGSFAGAFGFVVIVFLLIAVVLWFLLPFAVFGTKARIDELIQINKRSNVVLEAIYEELHAMHKSSKSNDPDIPILQEEER